MKNIFLLGATGSIGRSALEVIEANAQDFNLVGIAYDKNHIEAKAIISKHNPKFIFSQSKESKQKGKLGASKLLNRYISSARVDVVISGISGFAGLDSTFQAVKSGKTVLLANKESIVAGGDILLPLAKKTGAKIIPIDSEHNAINQCINYSQKNLREINKITITASGGPFIARSLKDLKHVKLQDALQHPTWDMGAKITIDSATLINKCLEVIEAAYLFNLNSSQIDVMVHPQSIVHSLVTYKDGSTIAQLSNPSMTVPIANALGMGALKKRVDISFDALFKRNTQLNFKTLPKDRREYFDLAFQVIDQKGNAGVVYNAANEVAVKAFIDGRIKFLGIYEVLKRTFKAIPWSKITDMKDIHHFDNYARKYALKVVKSLT
ncbi:MAG: 1-deoxy-D-xylulose-5-phosphate reductoisomerase [Gammaproteobacteria bacterium]